MPSVAMMTALPRPSMPPFDPPTTALPPIPTPAKKPKARKSLPSPSMSRIASSVTAPSKLAVRAVSKSQPPPSPPKLQQTSSSPSIPTLKPSVLSKASMAIPEQTVRRSISISAFPTPPKTVTRINTLASRPALPGPATAAPPDPLRRPSGDSYSSNTPNGSIRSKKLKSSSSVGLNSYITSPTLLNGSGDSVSISAGAGQRGSDGLLSLPSPPHSRSSSAQGSYSTTATTFEDVEDSPRRGREEASESAGNSQRQSNTKEGKGNVLVSVRVRPDTTAKDSKSEGEWMVDGRRSLVAYRGREGGNYFYDNVFAPHDNNYKVYDASAKRLVRRVMEGYHGTVFAYGMTGTGKTFSMQGTTASPGVIPLAITDIFSYIRETPHREFLLRVSYLEIYNEKIYDLLSPHTGGGPGGGQEEIKLREDSKRGVYATPLKEEIVQSPTQLLRVIGRGDHARKTGTTQFNAHSSRSHAVVQIVVESRERLIMDASGMEDKRAPLAPGGVRVSTLSLIDLAGSERAADDKSRRTEGAHINKSLLTLGTVIARLSGDKDKAGNPTDKDGRHLPYRDSKLTRLLQGALSGGSLVSILCTIMIGGGGGNGAASSNHTGETLNTLKFASRAKNNIVSHAKKAEEALGGATDASRGLLERYRMEIQTLRSQLETQAKAEMEKEELQMEKEAEVRHEEQMLEMQLARTALKERIEHLNRLILSSQSIGVNGTFSSLSMHPQLTAYHTQSIGARSLRSSASHSSLVRTVSGASTTTLGTKLVGSRTPASIFPSGPTGEEDDSLGAYGDGTATLEAQNRALQSDLADKNRYINTLEKRLVQARRSSTNRASAGFPSVASLHEKDVEIASLRTQVAERDRKLANLEALAAKRSGLDTPSITPVSPSRHEPHSSHGSSDLEHSHNTSLSPVELLSPTKVSFDMGTADRGRRDSEGGRDRSANRKSVDEMSRILDEMIQDRVERGEVVRVAGKVGMRATRERRQESLAVVPSVGALVKGLRPDSQQVGLGLGI